jgi:uncharacterized DUF497 family protein
VSRPEPSFEWDEDKRQSNIEKHDIDFGDAVAIFDGRSTTTRKTDYADEDRFVTIGKLDHRTFAVIWTQRGNTRRIISVRRARKNEIALLLAKEQSETNRS